MAFMMPVMKNNYDIYKDTRSRSRKTSECSNASSGGNNSTALATALGTPAGTAGAGTAGQQRRRKVSECKSESFATSPSHGQLGAHRMQMQRCHSSRGFTRNTSRSSHGSMLQMSQQQQMMMMSPTRSSPPSRTQTASALERQAAAQAAAQSAAAAAQQQRSVTGGSAAGGAEQSSNDYTKFHMRLVDKLRKSFRKDNGKRSWEHVTHVTHSQSSKSNNNINNNNNNSNNINNSSNSSRGSRQHYDNNNAWRGAAGRRQSSSQSQLRSPSPSPSSSQLQHRRPSTGVVSRLGRRFRRCCQALGAAAAKGDAAANVDTDVDCTAAELDFNDADGGSGGSAEQLTASSPYSLRRYRRRCSSGSSLNRLKLRLRRTTSSPG